MVPIKYLYAQNLWDMVSVKCLFLFLFFFFDGSEMLKHDYTPVMLKRISNILRDLSSPWCP